MSSCAHGMETAAAGADRTSAANAITAPVPTADTTIQKTATANIILLRQCFNI